LVLWWLKIPLTWPIFVLLIIFFAATVLIVHFLVIPAYHRKITTGREELIGLEGRVVETLKPNGTIKVNSEYWKAVSLEGNIEIGEKVEIAGSAGLLLKVKRLASPGLKRYDSNKPSNI
jgi:membrane-bound serine protease (ClpP class)